MSNTQNMQNQLPEWEKRSPKERLESMNNSKVYMIAKASEKIKEGKPPVWKTKATNKELDNTMPYNALTGKPVYGLEEVAFRSAMHANEYKSPQFIAIKQAMNMKIDYRLKEGEKPLRVPVKKDREYVVAEDRNGNPILNKEKPTWIDKDGVEQPNYIQIERPLAQKQVESYAYYNIEQFQNPEVFKEHFKERDMTQVEKKRQEFDNTGITPDFQKILAPLVKTPNTNEVGLFQSTAREIEHFMQTRYMGKDFEPLVQEKEKTQEKGQEKPKAQTQDKPKNKGMER